MSPSAARADPNSLFREAEMHFAAKRYAAARPVIERLQLLVPGHSAVLHLYGLVLLELGALLEARRALEAARAGAPTDPQIANNLGNLLARMADGSAAIAAYDSAIAAEPDFTVSHLNRAIELGKLGRFTEARAGFAALERLAPGMPNALLARASMERDAGNAAAAAEALDTLLATEPSNGRARAGRARLAIDLGEPDIVAVYRRWLADDPTHRDLLLGYVEATSGGDGRRDAIERLGRAVAADPAWLEGQRELARARWEDGDHRGYVEGYEAAIALRSSDIDLWRSYIGTVGLTDDHAAVARIARRAADATGSKDFLGAAVGYLSASGDLDSADALLDTLPTALVPLVVRAQHLLRRREPHAAEILLSEACAAAPDDIEAWALRGIAWQTTGDDRFHWLNGQPGLSGVTELSLNASEIEQIVARLRQFHGGGSEALGQSLRRGTQTRGDLFQRRDPVMAKLRAVITDAVEAHRAGMPAADPLHPILRHRDSPLGFAGAWSIRITEGGFHVQHIHPRGILSAASYWVVPPTDPDDPMAGWLEIGGAPAYLGLPMIPYLTVEPKVGRLTLFPSTLHHGTRAFSLGERISVAFDVVPGRAY